MTGRRLIALSPLLIGLGLLSACGLTPSNESPQASASRAADQALAMVGRPYRYGGNSPKGFDCSGLVQYSYARAGVHLPRDTRGLWQASRPVPRQAIRRGDLLFFDQEGKRASHVAIYLGHGRFVHAPSGGKSVYVTNLHESYWQRHFTQARRIDAD